MLIQSSRSIAVPLLWCVCLALNTTPLLAQPVRLELRPRAGDTLMLRIEQQTELIGSILRPSRDTSITIKTSMLMFARAVIERTDHYGAVVMALTDSMSANSTPEDAGDFQAMERGIVGKRVYMRVLPDGSSELIGTDGTINSIIRAFLADMPATLPSGPVEVGATWERVVNLPLQAGGRPHSVRTTFQLDSLSLGRRMAYISMRGLIVEAQTLPDSAARTTTSGNMKGNMTLDRQRGWIVASVATITIKAIVKRPIESALPPLNFQIRITQEMRTLNQR